MHFLERSVAVEDLPSHRTESTNYFVRACASMRLYICPCMCSCAHACACVASASRTLPVASAAVVRLAIFARTLLQEVDIVRTFPALSNAIAPTQHLFFTRSAWSSSEAKRGRRRRRTCTRTRTWSDTNASVDRCRCRENGLGDDRSMRVASLFRSGRTRGLEKLQDAWAPGAIEQRNVPGRGLPCCQSLLEGVLECRASNLVHCLIARRHTCRKFKWTERPCASTRPRIAGDHPPLWRIASVGRGRAA